jgi:DNA-directed RNA polymerase subunit M
MLYPSPEGGVRCSKCGYTSSKVESRKITEEVEAKEVVVLEGDPATLPKMRVECSECGNMEAYWVLRQTRRSDEPETTIFTCTKCKHRWRKY